MPYKKIEIMLTDEIKVYMDMLVKLGLYKDSNTLTSTALGSLIEKKEHTLSLRKKISKMKYRQKVS